MDWETRGKIAASSQKRKVIESLKSKPKTPKELSEQTGMQFSNTSKTLAELQKQGIVECLTPNLRKGKLFRLKAKTIS